MQAHDRAYNRAYAQKVKYFSFGEVSFLMGESYGLFGLAQFLT